MSWYSFYQKVGGEEAWVLTLAEHLEQVRADVNPMFITALDVDNSFQSELTAEELGKLHYRGPLYVDFDSSDIEEAIAQFKKFLAKLTGLGVDLAMLNLYASGGKGFHCIIPCGCFMAKVPPRGVVGLPHIYKEMAASEELFVDTLDLRVYTARRGRMFRQANVERLGKDGQPCGRFKVPLSVTEATDMTVEAYHQLVSRPRRIITPKPAELNTSLALLYQTACDRVETALKKPKKSKADVALIQRFKGEIPASVQALMAGENVAPGVGFQKIATQLALTMQALAVPEERMLQMCEGLVRHHQSDGDRYNTPDKRRRELVRMYRYMQDNVAYTFSVGGIKSVIHSDCDTPDLNSGGVELHEEEEHDDGIDRSLLQGMRVNASGIYRNTEEGLQKISAMGLLSPKMLLDITTDEVLGYEVDIYVDGKKKATKVIEMGAFGSRSKFMAFTLSTAGVSMNANDMQVGALADILRARAEKAGEVVYTVPSEGLDVVVRPDSELDIVWADTSGVRSASGTQYKLAGGFTSEPQYRTDIAKAPQLTDTPEHREFFRHLLNVNKAELVAKMLGWYTICYFSQMIRYSFEQFPMLQVVGQAESGKSKTCELFMRMHYYRRPIRKASATSMTPFAMDALASGSASVPFFIDEFKPRQMRKDRVDKLENIMRENYTGLGISKGRVSAETGASRLQLKDVRNAAPLLLMTEAAILQTAIVHRTVYATFSKASLEGKGCTDSYNHCAANTEPLSMYGRLCLEKALCVNVKALARMVEANRQKVVASASEAEAKMHRSVFNQAVVLTGLDIAGRLLEGVFGEAFSDEVDRLKTTLLSTPGTISEHQRSELAKVLDTMAYLSQMQEAYDERGLRMIAGIDYLVIDNVVELKVRACWDKYVRYRRSLGEEVLFDSVEAFIHGAVSSGGVIDKYSIASALKESPSTIVHTLSLPWMKKEGVAEFRP